jgi:hypothetical protein
MRFERRHTRWYDGACLPKVHITIRNITGGGLNRVHPLCGRKNWTTPPPMDPIFVGLHRLRQPEAHGPRGVAQSRAVDEAVHAYMYTDLVSSIKTSK